jgi:hypothetical protein
MKQSVLVCSLLFLVGCSGETTTSSSSSGGAGASTGSHPASGSSTSKSTGVGSSTSASTGSGVACPMCGASTQVGTLATAAWNEISGIVASKDHPGSFYVHNDSGDSARFFAMDATGVDQGTFNVSNATAVDWEDIGRGPCANAAESCLYLADMGDNNAARTDYKLYRVKEPSALGAGAHTVTAETIPFAYPDGSHNAECLLVNPSSGEIVIVTKSLAGSSAYRFPTALADGVPVTLEKVTDAVSMPDLAQLVTGGDVKFDGSLAIIRTYGFAYGYPVQPGESLGAALAKPPCSLPVASEGQGEALGFLLDGKGFVTTSEGASSPVNRVDCATSP